MQRPAPPSAGFTLVEILAVMLIIGVLVLAVGLSVSGRATEDRLQSESRRVQHLMQLAADEALAHGVEMGLRATTEGFDFVMADPSDGSWSVIRNGTFRPRVVALPFQIELRVDGKRVDPVLPIPADAGTDEPQEPATEIEPAVLILSSGEMTPFTLDLRLPDEAVFYRVEGNLLGQLDTQRLDEDA